MKPFKSLSLLMVPMMFLFMLFFNACEEDTKEKIVEVIVNDTLIAVTVTSIDASPDMIAQGGTVTFTATTTKLSNVGALTKYWFASGGTLNAAEGDTVQWKAPDDAGTYVISVHATDGTFIGTGKMNVGVDMYAATADTFYVGGATCANCHNNANYKFKNDTWAGTAHAHAWQTLQESGHPQAFCNPCHTVDYDQVAGNAGYDDAPIELFENVQCESCHGPGSAHAAAPSASNILVSYDTETSCGTCHDGTHHPYLSDWKESTHGNSLKSSASGDTRASCWGCHEGVAASKRLSEDLGTWYGSGAVESRPSIDDVPQTDIGCAVCHDSHDATNPGQLRTVADVVLGPSNGEASQTITEGGTGKLCMQCHHARHTGDEQVPNGANRFGPHYSNQADMAAGHTGYHGVADPSFVWADPSHLKVQNSCKTCHVNMVEYDGTTAITGHSFKPTTAACANCHGVIADFDDIMALNDFDGDGSVEGLQSEVAGLLEVLDDELFTIAAEALLAKGIDTTGFYGDITDEDMVYYAYDADTVAIDSLVVPVEWRAVKWNLEFVADDQSFGIHNPDYAVQLMQQSYKYLTGNDVPGSVMIRGKGNEVADIQIIQ